HSTLDGRDRKWLGRARRACERAERGEGVPASERAGVWGGAPRQTQGPRRARRACEGAARGEGVPASDRAGVWGGAPRQTQGPRRARRACEGAARGEGVPASERAGVWGGAPRKHVTRVVSGAVLIAIAVGVVWFAPSLVFVAVAEI